MTRSDPTIDEERRLAAAANGAAWEWLTRTDRSDEDDAELLECAYAAAHHWRRATDPGAIERARAAWLLARVHTVCGHTELASKSARRCAELTAEAGDAAADFDHAYVDEAAARAHALAGDLATARIRRDAAAERAIAIADDDDRSIVTSDLADGPWFGLD